MPQTDYHLLEALADIAHAAGWRRYYGGDSREDVSKFIAWAQEFHAKHEHTDWNEVDYISTVDEFARLKMEGTEKDHLATLRAFEVRPVAEKDGNVYRCRPDDPHRFGFGVYGMDTDGLPQHVADFDIEAQALAARDALNLCQKEQVKP